MQYDLCVQCAVKGQEDRELVRKWPTRQAAVLLALMNSEGTISHLSDRANADSDQPGPNTTNNNKHTTVHLHVPMTAVYISDNNLPG